MRRQNLVNQIESLEKSVFSIKDLKKLFPDESNLGTSVKRMVDGGVILQVTRGVYALKNKPLDIEKIATQLYYPSYVSFESALSKYGILNQGLYCLTLATTRHSKKMELAGLDCEFSQIQPKLFFGFSLVNGTYLADPEKAFLDQVYMVSQGKRRGNFSEWNLEGLDQRKVVESLGSYNSVVQKMVSKLGF